MPRFAMVCVAGLVLGLSAGVRAQESFAGTFDPGTNQCVILDAGCTSDAACAASPAGTSTCTAIAIDGITQRVCLPESSAFCCVEGGAVCPDGRRCLVGATGDVGLCVRESDDYCGATTNTTQIRTCHTSPTGEVPVAYDEGDCDGDGVRNRAELTATTNVCSAPAGDHGVIVADGAGGAACLAGVAPCEDVDAPCTLEGDARARCAHNERTGEAAPLCSVPPDLFCCGGLQGLQCPAGECVLPTDIDDHFGVCTDPSLLCPDRSEALLTQCHRGIDGRGPVAIEDGDCDEDGVANAREVELGRDHCGPDDAQDAGTTPDSGPRPDAGAPPGPTLEVSFGGGGGCRCGIGARGTPTIARALLIGLGLAFALRRGTRRRSRRPRGSTLPSPCRE